MQSDGLKWFVALAERENLTATAKTLNIAPSTLSRALQRLEAQVGAPLFERRGRGICLNRYGRVYAKAVYEAIERLDCATSEIADLLQPDAGEIRIAYIDSLGSWLIHNLVIPYRLDLPHFHFSLWSGSRDEMTARLLVGTTDFIVTTQQPVGSTIAWRTLGREQLYLAVAADHRFARLAETDLRSAAAENFIVGRRDGELAKLLNLLCGRAGFAPKIMFETPYPPAVRDLVTAGLGLAVIPKPFGLVESDDIAYVSITDDDAYREFGIAWIKTRRHAPAIGHFIKFVDTLAHS